MGLLGAQLTLRCLDDRAPPAAPAAEAAGSPAPGRALSIRRRPGRIQCSGWAGSRPLRFDARLGRSLSWK